MEGKPDQFITRKIAIAAKTAETNGVKPINAKFEPYVPAGMPTNVFENVKIRVPDMEDPELKRVPKDGSTLKFVSIMNPYKVSEIKSYYRRGIFVGEKPNRKLLTRNFYNAGLLNFGTTVVAKVEVIKKINYEPGQEGEESLILDIHICNDPEAVPTLELKMDQPFGKFKVPGTNTAFDFIPIRKEEKEVTATPAPKRYTLIKKSQLV